MAGKDYAAFMSAFLRQADPAYSRFNSMCQPVVPFFKKI